MPTPKKQSADLPSVKPINPTDPEYPAAAKAAFPKSAPVIYCAGNVSLLRKLGVGICGSRKSSDKGLEAVKDCADQIAKSGVLVISGNAAGIDLAAHRTALESGGNTILVLPEGIHHFRIRKELRDVWDWNRVLVVSQFEPDAPWSIYRAMERNRVIIALSSAMIVVEAGETGGTVNAGLSTLKAGKPLYVAVYEDMPSSAPGNERLLQLGGKRVFKSRTSGRAKMVELFNALTSVSLLSAPDQLALL